MKSPEQYAMYVTSRNLSNETARYTNEATFVSSPIISLDRFLSDVLPRLFENLLNDSRWASNVTEPQKLMVCPPPPKKCL